MASRRAELFNPSSRSITALLVDLVPLRALPWLGLRILGGCGSLVLSLPVVEPPLRTVGPSHESLPPGSGIKRATHWAPEVVESSFQLEVRSAASASVIAVSGELDLASAPALEEELERAAENRADIVIVGLRALDFIDSTRLGLLIKAHRQAEAAGRTFAIVRGHSQVQRLLGVTGIDQRLKLVDSPEQLLGAAGD